MCCVSTREQDGHDVSCPHERREKQGREKQRRENIGEKQEAGKTGGGKNRGTSRGLLASQWRGEFRLTHLADKFLLKSMDY